MDVSQRRGSFAERRAAMLVVEPAEPCIYNVRLHQAYRTTVTLRNDTRNALELTVRAGSPERWAVAPSTVFLEAGRTMRVDLRLKLAREIRPKKTAGAAVREGDDEGGGAVRQRDVFHVKGEFFEQKFYASFVMATQEEVAAAERRESDARSRSIDHPGFGERGRAPIASTSSRDTTHRARSHSPASSAKSDEEIDEAFDRARARYGGGSKVWAQAGRSTSAPAGRGRGLGAGDEGPRAPLGRGPTSQRARAVHWEDETSKKVDAYRRRIDELEKLRAQSELATSDKDELIRALYARLELAKTAEDDARERVKLAGNFGGAGGEESSAGSGADLHAARVEQAELHGANAALRGRVQELDGECQAAREEIAGLRRRCRLLEQDIAPELSDLVHAALEQERAAFEAQSLKALRVLEAKDAVLLARERETAEARAECGALSTTLTATRRELDACEARVVSILEEREGFRKEFDEIRAQWTGTEKSLRVEVEKLGEELRIANERLDRTKEELREAREAEEESAFSRAEAAASTAALEAANEEASELRAALRAAAEARISERERLAAHVASARADLEALKRRAYEDADATRLAHDLAAAHESLAAALKDSPADRILSSASDIPESPGMSAKTPAPRPTRISASRRGVAAAANDDDDDVSRLRQERDEALERLERLTGKETAVAKLAEGHAKETAGLQLKVRELESALKLKDAEHRREKSSLAAEHAAESESLRTELAALRDRLRFVDDQRAAGGDLTDEARRAIEHADEKARAAESEAFLAREKLAEMEAAAATERASGKRKDKDPAPSRKGQGTTIEQKLSARVSELVRELRDSNDKVAELEDLLARQVGDGSGRFDDSAAASAMRQRVAAAEDAARDADERLASSELRWGNERARLESKIRAAKEDGGVRIQSLEATVASLRARSGLHSEVARLGEEASRIRRSEAALKNDLVYAEERLGHALLEIQRLGGEATTGNTPSDARRTGALALRSGNLPSTAAKSHGQTTPATLDRVVSLEKENARLVAENEQLRNDVEAHSLERGREAAARADASRELASALDRVAERDRALHDAREAAALGKERAAATRAQELTAATRRSAAAEARASESESRASLAREEANEARADCTRKVAAADGARHAAELDAAAAREEAANERSNAQASEREAARLSQLLEERATQLQILTETVEALQAAAGSGDREQRVVTLAAQAATARASESALERRCAELSRDSQRETARCARIESQLASAGRDIQSAEQRAREAAAREELAREETSAARQEAASRTEELAALARRCDAATEAKVAAESREASARAALEKQHARHLEQLTAEREAAADRLKTAELNAARAVQVAAGGVVERDGAVGARIFVRASEDIASIVSMQPEDAVAAVLEATRVRERIEHALEEVVAATSRRVGGADENDPIAAAVVGARRELEAERRWSGAVIQRMRQLVLEAEREVGRAFAQARGAQAGEQAAKVRAAAVEAALDARTAAWEEATAACVAAEERLARRSTVDTSCADQRFQLAQQRISQISEQLASAQRRCVAAESAAQAAKETARTETNRADAESRRARVAEADAAAARQAAAAAAEELEGSPAAADAVRELKSYLEKEVVRALVGDGKAKPDDAGAKLAGVTRELCASKLTERSLLASLAANRRRADAAAGHAAELQQALKMAETRIQALVSGDRGAATADPVSPEDSAEALSTQLAHKAHEAYQAREEVLRLRARVSELELEVADLAGAREAAAAAASSAREGARMEIAAAAARAADDFAAKSASLRRELDTERSVLQAAVREAQATANRARMDAAASIAEERARVESQTQAQIHVPSASFADAEEEIRALRLECARQEDRARRTAAEAADLRDEVQAKDGALQQLKRAFASVDDGGLGLGAKTPGSTSAKKAAGRRTPKSPASEPASSSGAALGRRLVEAKLAEADAQRRLKIAARAETELRDIVAKRDARIADLKKKLSAKPGSVPSAPPGGQTQVDDESRAVLEAECAKLRAEKSRADAESERLRAELEAHGAHAPSPEEMDALQAEVIELRRVAADASATASQRAKSDKKSEKEAAERRDLQRDVNTAVSSAAAALVGSPTPHAARNPAAGTATAAVAQLANALKESNNSLQKARQESNDAKRILRERGKERETKELADASQRSVIRELTQRAAALGRDKAELVEERDRLKERLRGLRGIEDWTPKEDPKPPSSEAATQSGSLGGGSVLVDAAALVKLVGAHVDAIAPSAAIVAERAAALGDGKVAEVANTLSVETAAMRAALDALCDPACEGLTPTELVTKAATAAMRAMPSAPLVYHIVPSVVAPVMRVAPLLADPNVTDAPVARIAIARADAGTDVAGLADVRDLGVNTAPVTAETRCGPDLDPREDPHLFGAPRDATTSPGVGPRVAMVDIDAPRMVEAGTYSAPISHDAGVGTEVTGAADEQLMEVTQRWEAALEGEKEKAAALEEKVGKWKDRCESLRAELAAVMEKTAETERSLRDRLAKEEKIEGVPKERVEELEGLLHSVGAAGGAAIKASLEASRKESAAIKLQLKRAQNELVAASRETERLRNEVRSRDAEHSHMVASLRTTIRGMRNAAPADRAAYLEALRIHSENADRSRLERESAAEASASVSTPEPARVDPVGVPDGVDTDAKVPSPVENILGGADDRRRIREAIRAEEDAEREAVRARAVADAAEAATKLWERGGEMAEQISQAERRLERAVATTAAALQAADRGAADAGERAAKRSRVLAGRLEEVDGAAVSLCAQLTDALARAVEKGEATTAAATRYKEMAARLREEHEADKKRAKEALKKAKQKEEAAEAKAKQEETRAKRAEADAARKKTALEIEVNRLKATIEEIAARRGSPSSGSDSESPPEPRAATSSHPALAPEPAPVPPSTTLMPPLLHASTRPPWSAPGEDAPVEDAVPAPRQTAPEPETNLSRVVSGPNAAQTAASELAKRLSNEKVAELQKRLDQYERDLDKARTAAKQAKDERAHAETRAKNAAEHLKKFKASSMADQAAMRGKVTDLTAQLAERGPDKWKAMEAQLADTAERLKRARAEIKRLQAVTAGTKGSNEALRQEKEKVAELEDQLKEETKRIKEARATAKRKDTFAADLKKRLDAATAECDKLKEAAANDESEVKLRELREDVDRKQALIVQLRSKAEEEAKKAAALAAMSEQERNSESTQRLRREVDRKTEIIKTHDKKIDAMRAEVEAAREAAALAEAGAAKVSAEFGGKSQHLRVRSVTMLTGVRKLAARLLRLSAAVGHTVGAAARADAPQPGPVETGIAELVDMSPDEVADLLGADSDDADDFAERRPRRIRGGRASNPSSFAALISAMDIKADELATSLSGRDAAVDHAGAEDATWREDALRWIVQAAEAEAEHAEAALKSAVPAMQEWWIQVLSRGRFPDVSGITTGFEAVSPGKSPTLRGSRGRDTAREPKRKKAPSGPVTGTRARLAGAAALLASPERDD